ncbi:MAG: MBL fold metallo-hydrolase [Chloroflexi bacterium]|nr:MBL fold metallo-hydrolase [Chloroflexota bacterium]
MAASHQPILPEGITLIDDQFLGHSGLIGTYILWDDQPALVDPGPTSSLPNLLAGLTAQGLAPDDLSAILLTHIHLDHASATGTLVRRYPHLRVYVHARGAPHMIDPERLIRSATRLYGDAMDRLWGEILPVPQDHVTALHGGEILQLGKRKVRVYDTPGHAMHHVSYFDEISQAVFVGDTTGVCLPGTGYVRPATPPPDIDLQGWQSSLDTLEALEPAMFLITHFGPVFAPEAHLEIFRSRLLAWAEVVRQGLESGADEGAQIDTLSRLAAAELGEKNASLWGAGYQQVTPIEQSWQGLARYWRKQL